jgi:hypothetical protein
MPVMRRPAAVWRLDLLGVRLGVLALVLPVAALSAAHVYASRGLWLHPPDSRYYMTMMARDQGDSVSAAIAGARAVAGWRLAPWYFAGNDPTWQLVKVRVLYPFLSVPFVALFGLGPGALVVPGLSLLAFLWVTAAAVQRLYSPAVAAVVVGAFAVTTTIPLQLWATTDLLTLALSAVLVANLPIERRVGPANLVWLGTATVLIALTRQVGVLAPAMAAAGWLWAWIRERHFRNRWLGAAAVTVAAASLTQLATTLVAHIDTQGIVARDQTTVGGAVGQFYRNAAHIVRADHQYMWEADRVLYVILGAAILMALLKIGRDFAAVFVGALAATCILVAATGLASDMRYEMILFPAAAVSAGAFVAWALDQRGSPFGARRRTGLGAGAGAGVRAGAAAAAEPQPAFESAFESAAAPGQGAGSEIGLGVTPAAGPDPGREPDFASYADNAHEQDDDTPSRVWIPQFVGCSVLLISCLVVSALGGARSTGPAPASPSAAAAQAGRPYTSQPVATPPAEVTLKSALTAALDVAGGAPDSELDTPFDWVHALRYRPAGPADPNWTRRAPDGTTVTRRNAMSSAEAVAFSDALTFDRTIDPATLRIVHRVTSRSGEDVAFEVSDKTGGVHRGTATTMYPIWDPKEPGLVTSLVYAP